jgi:hypothetical protein
MSHNDEVDVSYNDTLSYILLQLTLLHWGSGTVWFFSYVLIICAALCKKPCEQGKKKKLSL